jgi:hypothetical protein
MKVCDRININTKKRCPANENLFYYFYKVVNVFRQLLTLHFRRFILI